jgi:hypothetical protein
MMSVFIPTSSGMGVWEYLLDTFKDELGVVSKLNGFLKYGLMGENHIRVASYSVNGTYLSTASINLRKKAPSSNEM